MPTEAALENIVFTMEEFPAEIVWTARRTLCGKCGGCTMKGSHWTFNDYSAHECQNCHAVGVSHCRASKQQRGMLEFLASL